MASGGQNTDRPSRICGTPIRSSGANCVPSRLTHSSPSDSANSLTREDFPIPGAPQRNTGRTVARPSSSSGIRAGVTVTAACTQYSRGFAGNGARDGARSGTNSVGTERQERSRFSGGPRSGGLLARRVPRSLQGHLRPVALAQPAPQYAVYVLGADELLPSSTAADSASGASRKGSPWAPPSPPCEPICSSKASTSPSAGSYQELTMMSAVCGKECVRRTALAAPGPKSASGPPCSLPFPSRSSSASTGISAPCAPSTSPSCSSLATRTKPTPGWLARVVSSAGWRASISSRVMR